MSAIQFIKDHGVDVVREAIDEASAYGGGYLNGKTLELSKYAPSINAVFIPDLKRLVESVYIINKFNSVQEAKDAVSNAPDEATEYRKLGCSTRYIKVSHRFFEYWDGVKWCRPTVPFTDETHILRFTELSRLEQAIADYEAIGGEHV